MMDEVFVYWDNSNIYYGAKDVAGQREGNIGGRYRVRLNFTNLLRLAHADRQIHSALAAGAVPPEVESLWNRMKQSGVDVHLFDRGGHDRGEQQVPDHMLQVRMLRDTMDHNGCPGIVVVLTGDGAGYFRGEGFHRDLERMHRKGWRIEVLSWLDCCNSRLLDWIEEIGVFVPLDDFYESITFLEKGRTSKELNLSLRPTV